MFGKDKVVRLIVGLSNKAGIEVGALERATLNGLPGFVSRGAQGVETLAIEVADGLVVAIYAVRNPDKLRHFS